LILRFDAVSCIHKALSQNLSVDDSPRAVDASVDERGSKARVIHNDVKLLERRERAICMRDSCRESYREGADLRVLVRLDSDRLGVRGGSWDRSCYTSPGVWFRYNI